MGAKESNIKEYSHDGLRDFHSNFTFLKVEEDPRLGKIHLFTEKTSGKHIGLFNKACPDAQKLEKLRNQLHDRISMDHVNILKIVGYVIKSQENICGTSDVFTVFVEWYEHDLELEIVERATRSVFQYFLIIRNISKSQRCGIWLIHSLVHVLIWKRIMYIMEI
jgi:hypothetical protein